MKKINILTVGNSPKVNGGITSVITQIMNYNWDEYDINMEFVPSYINKNFFINFFYFFSAYIRIIFYLICRKIDIAHIHMSYKGSFVRANILVCLIKKFNIPVIIHLHGSEFKKWYDTLDNSQSNKVRAFLKTIDYLIVLGDKWKDSILKIEPETNIIVIKNSVKKLNFSVNWNEPVTILFLGVLIKRKGVSDLIKAYSKAVSMLEHETKLIIAGSGSEEEKLKTEVSKYNLDNRVVFTGWINGEEKNDILKKSQLMILPSYNEGLPISILEALSIGMPVISTDVGSISEAVINEYNGYLFNPGCVEELAKLIIKIVNDKQAWRKLSLNAQDIASREFSEKVFFDRLNRLYKKVEKI